MPQGSDTTADSSCQKGPPTTNPHDETRSAGGSSSGSGAVVADYQVPISLGTQTGGSTIRPASYNGVFALKPTWNAISREGLKMCMSVFYTMLHTDDRLNHM